MRVRFVGPKVVRRVVGEVVWSGETGFVQELDVELAANLLTAPGGRWAVEGRVSGEEVEQLMEVLGVDRLAAELFLEDAGGTVEQGWKEAGDIGD